MEWEWTRFAGELIIGVVLTAFAWAFRHWAAAIKDSSARILERIDKLAREFAEHRLKNESRMTKVETELHGVHKRLDDCKIRRVNDGD